MTGPGVELWCDGGHDPAENMRRDRALLDAAEAGAAPVMRLFAFTPHGITLGHAQDPARELDLAACRRDGVPWAVRPTGGRAIFHAEEWTYAFAAPLDDPVWGGGRAESWQRIASLVARSLVRLGIPATLARPEAGRAHAVAGPGMPAPPCFASTARHEITLTGAKLAGSAQRRTARALLQQGSVLLGSAHVRLVDYLAVPDAERPAMRAALARAAHPAGAWIGVHAPLARWADALQALLPDACRTDGPIGPRRHDAVGRTA